MKAKVIIENGISTIVLTCENDFERTMLEDANNPRSNYTKSVSIITHSIMSSINPSIEIKLNNNN